MNEFWLISSRLYRKAQGEACTQACRNRRRDRKSMDYGACRTVMRKCKAWDGTSDEDRNMSRMRQ